MAYVELVAHVQHLVYSMQHHPLETFMGLNGPLLQSMAAERHLTEQLLSSCASAQGRIVKNGNPAVAAEALAGKPAARYKSKRLQRQQQQQRRQQQQQLRQKSLWGPRGRRGGGPSLASTADSLGSVGAPVATLASDASAALDHAVDGCDGGAIDAMPAADTLGGVGGYAPDDAEHEVVSEAEAALTGEAAGAASAVSPHEGPLDDPGEVEAPGQDREASASETSDETDSSDEDDASGLLHDDALAAVLPRSASVLAAPAAAASSDTAAAAADAQATTSDTDAAAATAAAEQLHPAAAEAADGTNEMQQALLEAQRELFAMYKQRCRPLAAAAEDVYHPARGVMHVAVGRAEAVVMICLPGNQASAAMAHEVITRVDPASEGVPMERYQSISVDVGLQDIVAHFGGVEEVSGHEVA